MRENGEYILNYAALLACIVSEVTSERAIKLITKQELVVPKHIRRIEQGKRLGSSRRVQTKVTNVVTGKVMLFESATEACKNLGVYKTVASNYIKSRKIYKGTYLFEKLESEEV